MLKVSLNPVVFSHDELSAPELKNNIFYKHSLIVLDNLKDKIDLDVDNLVRSYDLLFPKEVVININFVSSSQKEELCAIFDFDSEKTLGFYATSSGDGFIANSYHLNSFEVFVFCPSNEEYFNMIKDNQEYNFETLNESLSRCLVTVTHEIYHALIFIESSGGMTPHEVDMVYNSDEFDNDISDCICGCNIERYDDYFYSHDYREPVNFSEINEEIVEIEGTELLKALKIDLETMVKDIQHTCNKSFKKVFENETNKVYD